MPTPSLPLNVQQQVRDMLGEGLSHRMIATALGVSVGTVSNVRNMAGVKSDKKVGTFNLNEWLDWMETGQALRKKASFSQNEAVITLTEETGKPQIVCPQGDWHIASWGTSHKLTRTAIQEVKTTPDTWWPLMGDLVQMAIKLRSVVEVSDNMIPPELQADFLEQLIEEIMARVPFSTWCNHAVEREEKQSGISAIKRILNRRTVYFNGIGHPDLKVGKQVYKCAASHKYRGNSMYDTTYALKRYRRMEANDRELIIGADNHQPGFSVSYEGGMQVVALRTGTHQLASGYAQRYFSLKTWPTMPCVVLHSDEHKIVPFLNLEQALRYIGQ